jgi:hypothetical protein
MLLLHDSLHVGSEKSRGTPPLVPAQRSR